MNILWRAAAYFLGDDIDTLPTGLFLDFGREGNDRITPRDKRWAKVFVLAREILMNK